MTMTSEQVAQLVKDTNALLNIYMAHANKAAKESFENMKRLEQALQETKAEMAQLRREMCIEIREETKKAVKEALEEQTIEFEKRLKVATDDVLEMARVLFKERKETAMQTRILSWKAVVGMAVGMSAMAIGAGTYVENRYQALQKINAENERTEYSLHAKKVLDQISINKCGTKVCVKVDPNEKSYGGEGEEYRVVAE